MDGENVVVYRELMANGCHLGFKSNDNLHNSALM